MDPTLYCPACGYNLTGLPEDRCPECGRPFSRAELLRRTLLGPQISSRSVLFFFWGVPLAFWLLGGVFFLLLNVTQRQLAQRVFFVGMLLLVGLALFNVVWLCRKSIEADRGRPGESRKLKFAVLFVMGLFWQAVASLAGLVLLFMLGALISAFF